jgi:hypothetical protein
MEDLFSVLSIKKEGTKWQPLLKKREPGGGEGRGSDKEKGARRRRGKRE